MYMWHGNKALAKRLSFRICLTMNIIIYSRHSRVDTNVCHFLKSCMLFFFFFKYFIFLHPFDRYRTNTFKIGAR